MLLFTYNVAFYVKFEQKILILFLFLTNDVITLDINNRLPSSVRNFNAESIKIIWFWAKYLEMLFWMLCKFSNFSLH